MEDCNTPKYSRVHTTALNTKQENQAKESKLEEGWYEYSHQSAYLAQGNVTIQYEFDFDLQHDDILCKDKRVSTTVNDISV